jgi:ATP:cob(I)alamin adenosyltransferase
VDELNAYLGTVKVSPDINKIVLAMTKKKISFIKILDDIQQNLFVIQAELGGSKMTVNKKELTNIEKIINKIGEILPPITSFTVSGGSVISASLDFSRTLARKAERRIISVSEEGSRIVGLGTLSYLNRLSSVLFAMSRYSNYFFSIPEEHPDYYKK